MAQAMGSAGAASASCIRSAGVGLPDGTDRDWRLRKGQGGSVQRWLRDGDRKGPLGGGVEASAAGPAVATASLVFLPSVLWAGVLDPSWVALSLPTWHGKNCMPLWDSGSDGETQEAK